MPLYDFDCPACDTTFEMAMSHEELVENDYLISCRECGKWAVYIPRMPAIHTIETHLRGCRETNGSGGEYYDENLPDEKGNPTRITSLRHKQRELKKRGLYEKPPNKARENELKQRRSVFVTKPSGQAA